MLKKIMLIGCISAFLFAGMQAVAATATEVVAADKEIVTSNAYERVTLSLFETSKPLTLEAFGTVPTNSPVVFFSLSTDGAGVVHTNNLTTVHCDSSGNLATNLTAGSATAFSGYLFKRDPMYVSFTYATNGAYRIVGEIYK